MRQESRKLLGVRRKEHVWRIRVAACRRSAREKRGGARREELEARVRRGRRRPLFLEGSDSGACANTGGEGCGRVDDGRLPGWVWKEEG